MARIRYASAPRLVLRSTLLRMRGRLTAAALDTHLRSALNASDFDKTHQSLEQRFETYPALARKLANYMAMEQRKASYVADDEAVHVTAVLKKVVDASKMTAELRLEQLNAEVLTFRQTKDMTTAEFLEEAEEKHEAARAHTGTGAQNR